MSIIRTIPYAVLSAGLLAAGGASAQSMGSIDAREAQQQDRIRDGLRDGSLTRSEANRLERGEQRIERYEAHARANGPVTPYERQRLDNMLDRESRDIHRERTDGQRADGRGWGDRDGWGRDHDGGNRGQHEGWARGEHNGWDGNRPPGAERRDAREDRAERRDAREDRSERRDAREDGRFGNRRDERSASNTQPGNGSHNWGNGGWQHQPQAGNTTPTSGTQPGNGSHNWGNGGWQHQPQAGNTTPTSGTQPGTGSHNWGNGGWQHQPQAGNTPPNGTQPTNGSRNWANGGSRQPQAGNTTPTTPATGTQPNTGSRNWGGYHVQQASATPTATPRAMMTRASAPAPSTGGSRSWGGRH